MNSNNPHQTKTYISEANQNRISENLSVDEVHNGQTSAQATESTSATPLSDTDAQTEEQQTGNHEPEALSAPILPLPPTSAAADAEAVAGIAIGTTYGDEGEIHADDKSSSSNATE